MKIQQTSQLLLVQLILPATHLLTDDLAASDVDPATNANVEGVAAVATAKGTVGTKGTKGNSSKIPKKVCILWIVFI